jgi:uncharacterized membrane protein YeiB
MNLFGKGDVIMLYAFCGILLGLLMRIAVAIESLK